jgi:hypothetical protein
MGARANLAVTFPLTNLSTREGLRLKVPMTMTMMMVTKIEIKTSVKDSQIREHAMSHKTTHLERLKTSIRVSKLMLAQITKQRMLVPRKVVGNHADHRDRCPSASLR